MVTAVTDPNDLERRVDSPEAEVARLREQMSVAATDAGAARVLAAGADRDVGEVRAELRAHTQALNALRETQLDQGREIAALRDEQQAGFAKVNAGMTAIHNLLERLADSDGGSQSWRWPSRTARRCSG